MKRLIAVAVLAARLAAGASTVAETRLTAPRATQLAQGTITICANAAFTSLNDVVVDPGVCTVTPVVNGAFTVALEPTPAGIRYTAQWDLDGGRPRSEQWFVPAATTTLRLRDVQMGTGVIADAWRGAWDVAVGYSAYDKVSYGGSSWIAIASNTGVTPGTNAAKWGLLAAKGDTGAAGVVAATAPVTYDAETNAVACPTCATQTEVDSKEPVITGGLVTEYWAGTKVWRNFSADVLSAMAASMGLKAPLASPAFTGGLGIGTTIHSDATSEPACDVTKRGYIVRVQGGAGVADTYRQCIKGSDDGYSWAAFGSSGGGGTWGSITGTLSAQTDLNTALGLKAPLAAPVFTGQPTISDFTLAGHSHQDTAGGGTLDAAAIAAGVLTIARGGTGAASTSQNFAFLGPPSGSGAPSFRALVAGDIPTIAESQVTGLVADLAAKAASNAATTVNGQSCALGSTCTVTAAPNAAIALGSSGAGGVSGTLPIANGGTGAATTSQNFVFGGPTSGSGAPAFRALVAADIPLALQNGTTATTQPAGTDSDALANVRYVNTAVSAACVATTYTISYTDSAFLASSTAPTKTLFTLGSDQRLNWIVARPQTAYAGTGVTSLAMAIGTATNPSVYLYSLSAMQTTQTASQGGGSYRATDLGTPDSSGGVVATFTSNVAVGSGSVTVLTAGKVWVTACVSSLPAGV